MISINEIVSYSNIDTCLKLISKSRNTCGIDGMRLYEIEDYFKLNKDTIISSIINGTYNFNTIEETEIVNYRGNKRTIFKITSKDKFILQLIKNKLELKISFSNSIYGFINGRGVDSCVSLARNKINDGYVYASKIDIKDFFDTIDRNILYGFLFDIVDSDILNLIKKHLESSIFSNGNFSKLNKGIIQGSPISPILSNIYLNTFDEFLNKNNVFHVRYVDDILILSKTETDAINNYNLAITFLKDNLNLSINEIKSSVSKIDSLVFLGYLILYNEQTKEYIAIRPSKNKTNIYNKWIESSLEKINGEYHILQNGILTNKDFSLLFENEKSSIKIPVEATEIINVYSNVIFSSNFFEYISKKKILVNIYNKYGDKTGSYTPNSLNINEKYSLVQYSYYQNESKRLEIAKTFAIVAAHNINENLKYYLKHNSNDHIQTSIKEISNFIKKENETLNITNLLCIEGQIRKTYYSCFRYILSNTTFDFDNRNRKPPRDEINALISFGNTILYSKLTSMIIRCGINNSISYLHSTNKRKNSLDLDLSEIFKPIIIDRTIFKVVNKMIINKTHFEHNSDGSVLLNEEGKRLFIKKINEKIYSKIKIDSKYYSYEDIMQKEVYKLAKLFSSEDYKYKGYKHFN